MNQIANSPKTRQIAYYAGGLLLAVLGIIQVLTGADPDSVTTAGEYITGILTVLGATAPVYAGTKVGVQIKDGTLS